MSGTCSSQPQLLLFSCVRRLAACKQLLSVLVLVAVFRYMAPEVLSSQVTPASDVWAAGVMAHQLLTGRLPFDDHRNPFAPSISAVWRSVLTDKVDYNMPWWKGISDEGKDFVYMLLNRWV
jgi:serine/threonine protein kinase